MYIVTLTVSNNKHNILVTRCSNTIEDNPCVKDLANIVLQNCRELNISGNLNLQKIVECDGEYYDSDECEIEVPSDFSKIIYHI